MKDDYLIVHKSILPDFFDDVIAAREMIDNNTCSVSEACKTQNISRSTYYKYKDHVFKTGEKTGRKAIVSFKLPNKKGLLSNVLNAIASSGGNILTITQETPIHGIAIIIITLDTIDLQCSIVDLVTRLKEIDAIMDVSLVAVE